MYVIKRTLIVLDTPGTLYYRTRHFGFPEYTPEIKKAKKFKTYEEALEEKKYLGDKAEVVVYDKDRMQ